MAAFFGLDPADNQADDLNVDDMDIGPDPDFQEGCQFNKKRNDDGNLVPKPGRKRNWLTGYCRVPCEEDERRHPVTGVCTTLDDLEHEGVDLGRQYRYKPTERSIVDRSADDKRDRWAANNPNNDPNNDPNAWCPAGTRFNLATKKCKKVPECKAWQAVNPRTGRCAAREFLKRQVTEQQPHGPRLYEGEDSIRDANKKWAPDDETLVNNRPGMDDMINFIKASFLTVADLRTMRGVHEASTIHGIEDDGQTGGPPVEMIGLYSPPQRKKCDNSTFTRFLVSDFYACGFKKVGVLPDEDQDIENLVLKMGNDSDFIFIHKPMTYNLVKVLLKATQRSQQNRKFAVVNPEGVWRILVRYIPANMSLVQYRNIIDALNFEVQAPDGENRGAVAAYLDGIKPNDWCVSFHEFDGDTNPDWPAAAEDD